MGVTICNFELWQEKDESGRFKVPMRSRWRMQEQHARERGLPQVQYAFLELPKYAAGDEPKTLVDKWAYFFREAGNLDVVPPALSEGPFREALEVTRKTAFTPEEWDLYERAKMAEQDARGALMVARGEGKAEGLVEGKAEGIVEGNARAILTILATRGIAVDEATRTRIAGFSDTAMLDRWLIRALTAASAAEVVGFP